jgi:cytoskeletal protein RodZ
MFGRSGKTPDDTPPAPPKGFDDYDLRLGDILRGERATKGKSLLDVERELRIKAHHLAGIENCDLTAFEAPSFIAGYVRSYARYLGLDAESSFAQFCHETGFVPAHGLSPAASTAEVVAVRAKSAAQGQGGAYAQPPEGGLNYPHVAAGRGGLFSRLEPGAMGSLALLLAVMGGLGYGGWSVLQEVQKVQLAPVEQPPSIMADVPNLMQPPGSLAAPVQDPAAQSLAAVVGPGAPRLPRSTGDDLAARMAQAAPLEVPVLIARDGPISAIDPRKSGVLAAAANAADEAAVQVVEAPKLVEILAVRPSWISVTAADGTVLFEKILDAGERYAVPQLGVAPRLKAGNSSAVYFVMGGKTYGPASRGPEVVRNLDLSAQGVSTGFDLADASLDADLSTYLAQNTP